MKRRILALFLLLMIVFTTGYSKTYKSRSRSYKKSSSSSYKKSSSSNYKKSYSNTNTKATTVKPSTTYKSTNVKATSTTSKKSYDDYQDDTKTTASNTANTGTTGRTTSTSGTTNTNGTMGTTKIYNTSRGSGLSFWDRIWIGRMFSRNNNNYGTTTNSAGTEKQGSGGLILKLLIIGLILFAVISYMDRGGRKRKTKRNRDKENNGNKNMEEIKLPYGLEKGTYLEFDKDIFSNLSYDTRFLLHDHRNIIKDIEVYNIGSSEFKYANVILENEGESNTYLQLEMNGDKVEKSILYKNYDIVYPSNKSEWEEWLGNNFEAGIIGDSIFMISDEVEEKIEDVLYKLVKKVDKDTRAFERSKIEYKSKTELETDLLKIFANGSEERYNQLIKEIETDEYLKNLVKNVEETSKGHKISINQEFITEECDVVYDNLSEGMVTAISQKTGKKIEGSKYSRQISGEFFQEEYISAEAVSDDSKAYVRIDIGVEVNLDLHKI